MVRLKQPPRVLASVSGGEQVLRARMRRLVLPSSIADVPETPQHGKAWVKAPGPVDCLARALDRYPSPPTADTPLEPHSTHTMCQLLT